MGSHAVDDVVLGADALRQAQSEQRLNGAICQFCGLGFEHLQDSLGIRLHP